MVLLRYHGANMVSWLFCSNSYHFGRATHICGWLVFNWSSDSKQALWSVSMPMVIMIQFWYFLLRYIWRRVNRIWGLDFIALSKKGLIIWQRGYKQAPIISAKSSNSESTFSWDTLHCRYISFSVLFQTKSSLVWKRYTLKCVGFSKPIVPEMCLRYAQDTLKICPRYA